MSDKMNNFIAVIRGNGSLQCVQRGEGGVNTCPPIPPYCTTPFATPFATQVYRASQGKKDKPSYEL